MISRVVHVEHVFSSQAQVEAWLDSLRTKAWPYLWCIQDIPSGRWKVIALIETRNSHLETQRSRPIA